LLAATNDLSAAQAQLAVKAKENEALATAGRELVSGGDSLANELVSLKQQSASLQQDLMAARAAALAGETRSHELESALGELTGPKAAFFTQLAQALPPDTGAMIQGDRFVFPSDIAFKSASAKLTPNARAKVLEIGQALAAASEVLPDDSNWVIRIDGHTDRSSVGGQAFESNRDLAAARAVEVVRILAKAGVPPERLVAASFGEFRPLDAADSAEAYQRNRRIELRLDED